MSDEHHGDAATMANERRARIADLVRLAIDWAESWPGMSAEVKVLQDALDVIEPISPAHRIHVDREGDGDP